MTSPLRVLAGALLLTLAASSCQEASRDDGTTGTSPAAALVQPDAVPQMDAEDWPRADPRDLGFLPRRLDTIARDAKRVDSTCLAVVRKDRLVAEWDWQGVDPTTPREVFSVTKSIVSALVGVAVREGDLALDDRASRYVREWRGTSSADVTVRNLLSNDSGRFWSAESDYGDMTDARNRTAYAVGLDQQFPPGTTWAYNNAAIQVLDEVISEATGTLTDEYAATRLFAPLGMDRTSLTRDASGRSTNAYFGTQTTCRDLARFGRLYLDGGRVDGKRILDGGYVRASLRPSTPHNAAYGFLWWLNTDGPIRGALDPVDEDGQPLTPVVGQVAPGAPERLYAAQGLGGQIVMVDPRTRTIVVRLGQGGFAADPGYGLGDAARVVTWALRP